MKAATTPAVTGRTAFASIAAIGSVILASSCCLPILPFVFAASLAGSSTMESARGPVTMKFDGRRVSGPEGRAP